MEGVNRHAAAKGVGYLTFQHLVKHKKQDFIYLYIENNN